MWPPTPNDKRIRLGLIVNPVAGLGERVGLKSSDSAEMKESGTLMTLDADSLLISADV